MKSQKQIERQIEEINNKICPNEIEEALAFLYAKVLHLEEENKELKFKLLRTNESDEDIWAKAYYEHDIFPKGVTK